MFSIYMLIDISDGLLVTVIKEAHSVLLESMAQAGGLCVEASNDRSQCIGEYLS